MSLLTEQARARLLARVELGVPLTDAAPGSGLRPETARSWLARGRREERGAYADFAAAVEAARAAARSVGGPVVSEDEALRLLSRAARAGSVAAMRALLAYHRERREPAVFDPLRDLDELAARRADRVIPNQEVPRWPRA